jgi:predicted HicB family RNase H-like nuclease
MGRKKKVPTTEKTISVRLDLYPDDHERLRIAARNKQLSLARYVRLVVLEAIRKDIKETK